MKRTIALFLAVVALFSLTACGKTNYDVLSELIAEKGEEKDSNMALAIGENSYMYQKDGHILLHRTETRTEQKMVMGVSLKITKESVEKSVYEWNVLAYRDHTEHKLVGSFTAVTLKNETIVLPYDSVTGFTPGDIDEKYLVQQSTEVLKSLLVEFAAALQKHGTGLTLADYGFTAFTVGE